MKRGIILLAGIWIFSLAGMGQTAPAGSTEELNNKVNRLEAEVAELKQMVKQLQSQQGASVEQSANTAVAPAIDALASASPEAAHPDNVSANLVTADDRRNLDFLRGTTVNLGLDTYYEYNFNIPVGRVNLLRAYDVLSNEFSLNQASVVFEHAPIWLPEGAGVGALTCSSVRPRTRYRGIL